VDFYNASGVVDWERAASKGKSKRHGALGERHIWRSPFLFSTSDNMHWRLATAIRKVKLEKMKLDEKYDGKADLKPILVAISKEYMLK
jgi:hypothetical protein